jgi:hypothetical protein
MFFVLNVGSFGLTLLAPSIGRSWNLLTAWNFLYHVDIIYVQGKSFWF